MVKLHVSIAPIHIEVNPHYNYDKANWDKYKEKLEAFSVPNLQGQPHTVLDQHWQRAMDAINHAAKEHVPYRTDIRYSNAINPSHKTKVLTQCYAKVSDLLMADFPTLNYKQQAKALLKELKVSWGEDLDNHYLRIHEKTEKSFKTTPEDFFKLISKLRGNYAPP